MEGSDSSRSRSSRRRREDENDWDSDQADGRPSSGQSNHKNAREAHDHRDGSGQRDDKHRTAKWEEKAEKLRHQDDYTYESNINLGTKDVEAPGNKVLT